MSSLSAEVAPFVPGTSYSGTYPHPYSYHNHVNPNYPSGGGVPLGGGGVTPSPHYSDQSVLQGSHTSSNYMPSSVPQYVDYQYQISDRISNADGRYYSGAQPSSNNQAQYSQQYNSTHSQYPPPLVYGDYQNVYQQAVQSHMQQSQHPAPTAQHHVQTAQQPLQATPHHPVTYQEHYQQGQYYQNTGPVPVAPYQQGPSQMPPSLPPPVAYQVPYGGVPGYQQSFPVGAVMPGQQPGVYAHPYSKGHKKQFRQNRGVHRPRDFSNVGSEAVTDAVTTEKKKKTLVYMDAECQTDFPEEVANKTLSERPIEELVPGYRADMKSQGNQTGKDDDSSSESDGDEVARPPDNDSGYYSPMQASVQTGHYPNNAQSQRESNACHDSHYNHPTSTSPSMSYAAVANAGPNFRMVPHHVPHQWPYPSPQTGPMPSAVRMTHSQMGPTSSESHMTPNQPPFPMSSMPPPNPAGRSYASVAGPLHRPMIIPPTAVVPPLPTSEMGHMVMQQVPNPAVTQMSKKQRKQKKVATVAVTNYIPPPMIHDTTEYPELPLAAVPVMHHPQSAVPHISYQQRRLAREGDSDTSSEKDDEAKTQMIQPEQLFSQQMAANSVKVGKNVRKRVKKATDASHKAAQEYSEISTEQQQVQELVKRPKPKTNRPIELDLSSMLIANVKQPHAPMMPPMPQGGPMPPNVYGLPPSGLAVPKLNNNLHAGVRLGLNPLDSLQVIRKGKMRETPVKKKPSAMKKIILKEREEKKRLRGMEEKKLSDEEEGLTQSTIGGLEEGNLGLSQEAYSDKNSLSFPTSHSDMSPLSQPEPLSLSPLSPGSPLHSGYISPSGKPNSASLVTLAKSSIHSNKFREYCQQKLTKEIDTCCITLLQSLVRFQDRQYHRDGPIKAKAKRRIVMGLREVTKHLKLKKIKCVVISPNLEKIQSKGGIDDTLNTITNVAREQDVPVVFALCRSALGRAVNKLVPVSVVGIFDYNGAHETFKQLMDLVREAQEAYQEMLRERQRELEMEAANAACMVRMSKRHHLGHKRNISNCSGISYKSVISEPISENFPEPEPDPELEDSYQVQSHVAKPSDEMTESTTALDGSTERSASEASACTVEDKQKKSKTSQENICGEIKEEKEDGEDDLEGEDAIELAGDDEEEEEEEDSEVLPLPADERSIEERTASWVAEAQSCIEKLSINEGSVSPAENSQIDR